MGLLREQNNKIYFDDELLMDFRKPILNYSRLPLYQDDPGLKSLFWTLATLIHAREDSDRFGDQFSYFDYYELIYYLVSRYMIGIPGTRSTKTIELGADNWILGYHLSVLLGAFHIENEYYFVTDTKDKQYTAFLENRINKEKQMEKVTLINQEYDVLSIENHSFDLVILNGSTLLDAPDEMVKSAISLIKPDGMLLVFNQFYNTVFDSVYDLKKTDKVKSFKSYVLDDEIAEVIVIKM